MDTGVLKTISDYVPQGFAIFDPDWRLRFHNSSWKKIVEQVDPSVADRIRQGAYFFDLVSLEERATLPVLNRALAGEVLRVDSVRIEHNGAIRYWDIVIAPMQEEGKITGSIHVITDTTDRMINARELEHFVVERTHEIERRGQVAEGLREIMKVLNSNHPLEEVLDHIVDQAGKLLGADAVAIYRLDETNSFLTIQAARGLDPDYVANMMIPVGEAAVGRVVITRQPLPQSDLRHMLPSLEDVENPQQREMIRHIWRLTERYRALLAVPLIAKDEAYGAISLYYPEPRKFKHEEIELAVTFGDQAALAIQNARLRARLEEAAITAERNRLARDLHDAVTQTLFSASLIAEVLPRIWEKDADEGHKRLEELRQLTRGALAEMRTLLLELRPSALVETELGDLLRQLAEAVTGRARIPVALSSEGQYQLPPDVKIALYRIAQEALNNIVRHSCAQQAGLSLRCSAEGIALNISDNGRGFSKEQIAVDSLGLGIMRERADAIGATINIESRPDKGTVVDIHWLGGPRKE